MSLQRKAAMARVILSTTALAITLIASPEVFAGTATLDLSNLYAIDNDSRLIGIDVHTGDAQTIIALSGPEISCDALAFSPWGDLFGMNHHTLRIFRIDLDTGEVVHIGAANRALDGVHGISFDREGNLYGLTAGAADLISIDPDTGSSAIIGSTGVYFDHIGLAINFITNELYAMSGGADGQPDKIFELDKETGLATEVCSLDVDYPGVGLEFHSLSGELYALRDDRILTKIDMNACESPQIHTIGGITDTSNLAAQWPPPTGCWDIDEDAYYDVECGGWDCDDTDPAINPAADEVCGDGIDNDCDGLIDTDPECIAILVPDDQATILDAIDAAESGNTILVSPGVYRENLDFLGKDIKVHSVEGPIKTIIDGDQAGSVVAFTRGETEDAVLDGFTIKNGSGTYITLAPHWGWGGYVGGGVFCSGSTPTITNCKITWNYAVLGGGIYLRDSSPLITNCMITNNWTVGYIQGGGGLYFEGSSPTVTNCTIVKNFSRYYGGGVYCWSGSPRITNTILWGDFAIYGSEIHVQSGSPAVTYSDVDGGWSGEGNIDLNPLFYGGGNYHIRAVSACVDAGTDAGVYTDIDGQTRPWGAGFDMGADEFSTEPCSVIASSGNQFLALYMIPALALIFFSRRFLRG